MSEAIRRILSSSPPAAGDLPLHIDRAIVGGFTADRVAHAFAAGYQAALGSLLTERAGSLPEAAREKQLSLCVTERGGGHPRAIQTALRPAAGGFTLTGEKRWTTLSPQGTGLLLVAASTGVGADGKNQLRLVLVDALAPGVTVTPMAAVPFIPEIPHAEVRFEDVRVRAEDVLPGDGYLRFVKPFRTIEDVHVHAAILAYVLGVARRSGWPAPQGEAIVALLVATRALAVEDPLAPETHVALAGVLGAARRLLDEAEALWASVDGETRARWQRDRALLQVAEGARTKRTEAAYRALGGAALSEG